MSESVPRPPSPRPTVQLPTWVVIALVIILFSSCSAASDASEAASSARDAASSSQEAANSSGGQSMGSPTQDEVQAMCQLLGAVAVKQGLDLDKVFEGAPAPTSCQEAAQQTAKP